MVLLAKRCQKIDGHDRLKEMRACQVIWERSLL